ncbi:MAG: RloB domain-containing protein, partial [Saprospiraceae bacterium]|nr:RloB domain-containing protein [Saprospiraceae bacterium]
LIMCEGQTEKNYFQAIKEDEDYKQFLTAIDPQIISAKHPAPEHVVKEAINRAQKANDDGNAYEQVWVVFDHDNHANRRKAYEMATSEGFNIAFSAIAFEIWFLLHFAKTAKAFQNDKQLLIELVKYYPNYHKAKQNDFANLKDKLDLAFENVNWLKKQFPGNNHLTDYNPWTDIDILIRQLLEQ